MFHLQYEKPFSVIIVKHACVHRETRNSVKGLPCLSNQNFQAGAIAICLEWLRSKGGPCSCNPSSAMNPLQGAQKP